MPKEPKLDFGPTKKDHGWFYYVWNWKTYVFYALLIVCSIVAFIDQGIVGALSVAVQQMQSCLFLYIF